MKRSLLVALFVVMLFPTTATLYAQGGGVDGGGCVNSPENPTAILALAGSAGAGFAYLRTRMKARRKNSK